MSIKTIKVSEVAVGDQIPEEDGFLFEVIEIDELSDQEIELTLASDFSSIPKHWKCNGGVPVKFPKDSHISVASA